MIQPTNKELQEHLKGNLKNLYDWAYNCALDDTVLALQYVRKEGIGKDELQAIEKLKR